MSEEAKWALFVAGMALMAIWTLIWFTTEWNRRVRRRRRFAQGGEITGSSLGSDNVPVFLAGGRAWMRKPDGQWVEINDPTSR